MRKLYFAHRPPSTGIHLLCDPIPPRRETTAAFRTEKEETGSRKRTVNSSKPKPHG